MRLTRDAAAALHLQMAERLWREDRLEQAAAAMSAAFSSGLPASHQFDLQRMIDAELATRRRCVRVRLSEELELEAASLQPAWRTAVGAVACQAIRDVTRALDVRWPMPVLLTLVPDSSWVTFVHARYGYFATRSDRLKVVLPPSSAQLGGVLRSACLHEIAHAGVAVMAQGRAPRWLDEGIAVWVESDSRPAGDIVGAWPRFASADALSGALEGHAMSLDGRDAAICYALAGRMVQTEALRGGVAALQGWLLRIGAGEPWRRAYGRAFRRPFWRTEREWRRTLREARRR